MIPFTVEKLPTLSGPRQGQSAPRRRLYPWERTLPPVHEVHGAAEENGVVLDHGQRGGVGLRHVKGRWGWEWASEVAEDTLFTVDESPEMLYPPTRKIDAHQSLSLSERTASANAYLRDIMDADELDGIASVLDEELARLHESNTVSNDPDPFVGRRMAVIDNLMSDQVARLLVFPTGDIQNDLHIAPFVRHKLKYRRNGVRQGTEIFEPTAKAAETFATPILQVEWSPVLSGHRLDRQSTNLLVRLHASTHLIGIFPDPGYHPKTPLLAVTTERVAELTYDDTGGRRHIDVALDPTHWGRALVVDEGGGVWLWFEEKIEQLERVEKVMRLRMIKDAPASDPGALHRIAFGTQPGTALLMSQTSLILLDFEDSSRPPVLLYHLSRHERYFTAIEKSGAMRGASLTCVATTFELMWIDETNPGPPLLSWRHDLGNGSITNMALTHVAVDRGECVLLSSDALPHLLAFHFKEGPPPKLLRDPTHLLLRGSSGPFADIAILQPPRGQERSIACHMLIGMSPDGSLSATRAWEPAAKPSRTLRDCLPHLTQWDESVQTLSEGIEHGPHTQIRFLNDSHALTKSVTYDARWAWLGVNSTLEASEDQPTFDAQEFVAYLRELEAPFHTFVTASDLARDTFAFPTATRSHGLKSLQVDPRFAAEEMSLVTEIDYTRHFPTVINAGFCGPQAPPSPPPNAAALGLDILLSSTVLHTDDYLSPTSAGSRKNETAEETVAKAAERLTISDEPKGFSPTVLHPMLHQHESPESSDEATSSEGLLGGLQNDAVVSLLGEWQLGTDPAGYVWRPWRDAPTSSPQPGHITGRNIRPLPSPRATGLSATQPVSDDRLAGVSRPQPLSGRTVPTILRAAASVPTIVPASLEPRKGSPLGRRAPSSRPTSPTMDVMLGPSTQIERGPYGGRTAVKKKPAKKRIGGF